jgi:hypothetical protein
LREVMLTFVDEAGKVVASTRYTDVQSLSPAGFALGQAADSYLVIGTRTDAKRNASGFYAELGRTAQVPALAFARGRRFQRGLVGRGADGQRLRGREP